MRRYIIPILLLPIASLFAAAQTPRNGTLHKDIEVEQQTAPTRRDAARISVLPEVTLPALAKKQLLFSDRVVTAPVPNVASSLAPVAWTDPEAFTSQRGYVVAGVFPLLFNADLSAGYRIIDNNRTRLSAWLQYDGDIYRRDGHTWRSHQLDLGADLHQAIGRKSMLDAAVSYTWGRANQWQMQGIDDMSRTVCIGALDAAFSSKAAALDYKASFKVERAGFSHLKWDEIFAGPNTVTSPLHQTLFNIGGEAALPTGDNSNFGIGLTLDILNTASHNKPMIPFVGETLQAQNGKTSALLSVSPRWALHSSAATLSV
ncbi:MAG: hypothetical protein J1E29_00605, partial [Duncaniella sp.]|nr:hypothetical protein [Duncaniella sp.]